MQHFLIPIKTRFMKTRHFFLFILISMIPLTGNSQPFAAGDKVIGFGLGVGSTLYSGTGYSGRIPPLSASFEYGLQELGPGILGIGGYLGISSYKWETSILGSTYGWRYSSVIIGARGGYHYSFVEQLDTYAGLLLGYNVVSAKATGDWPGGITAEASGSGVAWSLYIGGRYYFTDSFAAMLELGYGIAWLNLGVAYKF
jgi:hypothetical protein